ncbi:MAG: HAD-IIIC family phosphatase [Bacilli bacterium]|nr:HAD-IIIC family phosphatase [Bacilli bacterium]
MEVLSYPFNSDLILKKKKSIKKQLLEKNNLVEKNIAILGGSTTSNIKLILELFLLDYGIKPNFYESEYNQFWQDAMFDNKELDEFKPDIIYIHTSYRNITNFPEITSDEESINELLNMEFSKFSSMWETLKRKYMCPIIQNNFEYPYYRILGNKDSIDIHGKTNFVIRLNALFSEYARNNESFYINDINYQSAQFGLDKWSDQFYWHMYKYALSMEAIPTLAFNVANIIKAIYGKNKKGLVLDLDNTLWGGIVGDDGVENIQIGQETSEGQVFQEFQNYLKELKNMGIILNINSKNDEKNAIAGLNHDDCILKPDDFIIIKANWNPKSQNIKEIATELNLGLDSLVFVDDNPAEREIIKQYAPDVETPDIKTPDKYIQILDHSGYFEVINISKDDIKKNEMYKKNIERNKMISSFDNYDDYLKSLNMTSKIEEFIPLYYSRISQLSNKSNQFNLTTKRYSQSDIENIAADKNYITLYGKLVDTFGDNGVVSVVIGDKRNDELHIDLWIMSCRVLKRDMEYAMFDSLVKKAKKEKIKKIIGYYYPTMKNGMVKDFYKNMGFNLLNEDEDGNSTWEYTIPSRYTKKNKFIEVEN